MRNYFFYNVGSTDLQAHVGRDGPLLPLLAVPELARYGATHWQVTTRLLEPDAGGILDNVVKLPKFIPFFEEMWRGHVAGGASGTSTLYLFVTRQDPPFKDDTQLAGEIMRKLVDRDLRERGARDFTLQVIELSINPADYDACMKEYRRILGEIFPDPVVVGGDYAYISLTSGTPQENFGLFFAASRVFKRNLKVYYLPREGVLQVLEIGHLFYKEDLLKEFHALEVAGAYGRAAEMAGRFNLSPFEQLVDLRVREALRNYDFSTAIEVLADGRDKSLDPVCQESWARQIALYMLLRDRYGTLAERARWKTLQTTWGTDYFQGCLEFVQILCENIQTNIANRHYALALGEFFRLLEDVKRLLVEKFYHASTDKQEGPVTLISGADKEVLSIIFRGKTAIPDTPTSPFAPFHQLVLALHARGLINPKRLERISFLEPNQKALEELLTIVLKNKGNAGAPYTPESEANRVALAKILEQMKQVQTLEETRNASEVAHGYVPITADSFATLGASVPHFLDQFLSNLRFLLLSVTSFALT